MCILLFIFYFKLHFTSFPKDSVCQPSLRTHLPSQTGSHYRGSHPITYGHLTHHWQLQMNQEQQPPDSTWSNLHKCFSLSPCCAGLDFFFFFCLIHSVQLQRTHIWNLVQWRSVWRSLRKSFFFKKLCWTKTLNGVKLPFVNARLFFLKGPGGKTKTWQTVFFY